MTIDERDLGPLARKLPISSIEPARHVEVREAVLRAVERAPAGVARPARATVVGITIALAAAAATIVFVLARSAPAPGVASYRATVQSTAAADLEHTTRVTRGIHDEIVRLRGGRVSISVERLARNERFRVLAGDGEVEVRGTAFDVVVVDDRLTEVTVHHGLVDVRVAGAAVVAVAGGEQWSRTAGVLAGARSPAPPDPTGSTTVAATTPAPGSVDSAQVRSTTTPSPAVPARSRRVATTSTPSSAPATSSSSISTASPSTIASPSPASSVVEPAEPVPARGPSDATAVERPAPPTPRSPTERAFDAGRAALRGGDFGTAAERFREAVAADPHAALAEDARYWRGIALARAGRDADARVALAEFLAHHPTSLHVGRASIVVGNLLVRAGELAAARARFEAALVDPDPGVRSAARSALAALPPP